MMQTIDFLLIMRLRVLERKFSSYGNLTKSKIYDIIYIESEREKIKIFLTSYPQLVYGASVKSADVVDAFEQFNSAMGTKITNLRCLFRLRRSDNAQNLPVYRINWSSVP